MGVGKDRARSARCDALDTRTYFRGFCFDCGASSFGMGEPGGINGVAAPDEVLLPPRRNSGLDFDQANRNGTKDYTGGVYRFPGESPSAATPGVRSARFNCFLYQVR